MDWQKPIFKENTASPPYTPADYNATFLAASGDLPFRHEWVMLMQGQFNMSEVAIEFKTFIDEHDKKCNQTQQPDTSEKAGVKRKAETLAEKPNAAEIL